MTNIFSFCFAIFRMNNQHFHDMNVREIAAVKFASAFRGWRVRVSFYRMYMLHGFKYPHGFAEARGNPEAEFAIEWLRDFARPDPDGLRGPVLIMED